MEHKSIYSKLLLTFLTLPAVAAIVVSFVFSSSVAALQTIPYKMNFQGKLADSAGVPLANGTYNMKFRIYDATSGGTLQWSEQRAVSAATGVTVTNGGLFSVQLGDVTSLPVAIFTTQNLYFEVELPTPATATCATASCEVYTEGPMTPRNKLGSSAYAFNSDTLDGLDSTAFASATGSANYIQNGTSPQTASFNVTGTGTIGGALTANGATLVKVTSAAAFQVQSATSVTVLTVDASSNQVVVGSLTNGVSLSATGMQYFGTAQPLKSITLSPEYPGATFTGDGTNNTGTLSSDFCSSSSLLNINATACGGATDEHNYYAWANTQATAQDYDIYIRYRMPSDYSTGSMSDMKIFGWGTTSATEIVSLSLYKGSGAACGTITNAIIANTAWNEGAQASPLGACTIAANDMVTFKVRVQAGQNNTARAGEISFAYKSKL